MTQDEITRMAQEAGFVGFDGKNKTLAKFAELVEEHTRKAWAKEFAGLGEWQCVHIIEDRNHNP